MVRHKKMPTADEPASCFDFAEMIAYLETCQLARQYFPEYLEIIRQMPMTASGKIQEFQLREIANDASRPRSIEPLL